jgi:hypothetical protein
MRQNWGGDGQGRRCGGRTCIRTQAFPFCKNSAKAPKSLVVWSSFPHGQAGLEPENVVFVILGLPKRKSGPYNPPIAEERGAERRRAPRQASEIKSNFGFRISSFGF